MHDARLRKATVPSRILSLSIVNQSSFSIIDIWSFFASLSDVLLTGYASTLLRTVNYREGALSLSHSVIVDLSRSLFLTLPVSAFLSVFLALSASTFLLSLSMWLYLFLCVSFFLCLSVCLTNFFFISLSFQVRRWQRRPGPHTSSVEQSTAPSSTWKAALEGRWNKRASSGLYLPLTLSLCQ